MKICFSNLKIRTKSLSKKILPKLIGLFFVFIVIIIVISNVIVELNARNYIYNSPRYIPSNQVGLLLGTSKYLAGGSINPYYIYRIEACVELLRQGKIKYIIVSGDNRKKNYNEPLQMRNDLIEYGINPAVIFLDYAGFRTLDSVIRAKEIFGQTSFTIISQPFHNKRAIYIAQTKGINAVALNARDVKPTFGLKVQVRETFARVKLMIDLYLINKQPKFLGEKITI
ncbi:MAG: ElyC/SanA/YdcF family protein [Bacteroidales bacterium]